MGWALAKLEPQPEPRSLGLIKESIGKRYGVMDLLDVFVEADGLTNDPKLRQRAAEFLRKQGKEDLARGLEAKE